MYETYGSCILWHRSLGERVLIKKERQKKNHDEHNVCTMKMMMNRPARTKGTKTTSRAHINLMEETMVGFVRERTNDRQGIRSDPSVYIETLVGKLVGGGRFLQKKKDGRYLPARPFRRLGSSLCHIDKGALSRSRRASCPRHLEWEREEGCYASASLRVDPDCDDGDFANSSSISQLGP